MKIFRCTLLLLLGAVMLFCCSCQMRVTSTPQPVETQVAECETTPVPEPSQDVMVPDEASVQSPAQTELSSTPAAGTPIGYEQAVEAVLAQHVEALPLKCSLDYDDGQTLYEVEVLGSDGVVYDVQVDAMSGTLMRTEVEDDGTPYSRDVVKIPYTQAVSVAMESIGECTFESFDIDTNAAGVVVYEVELLDAQRWEQDLEVDAATGALLTGQLPASQSEPSSQVQTPQTANGLPAGNYGGHHPDAHHNTLQAEVSSLTENMIISDGARNTASVALCGRCGQYPCVCGSSPAPVAACSACGQSPCVCPTEASVCGTCHQSPCVCNSGQSTAVSNTSSAVRSSACRTCHQSPCVCPAGSEYTGHHSRGHHARHGCH